jgi:diguanylate cyclase (GGDEF)-like protein
MGIRGQLTLLVAALVALALSAALFVQLQREVREDLFEFEQRNEKTLQAIGVTVALQVAQNDLSGLDTLVAQLHQAMSGRDLVELSVVDDEGRVLAHSTPSLFNTVTDDEFTREAIAVDGPMWSRDGDSFRIAVPAVSGIRWATVSARYSLARLEATHRRARWRLGLGAMALFGVLSVMLYVGLDRLVVGPVRALQQAARRMGEGHLGTRAPPLPGVELGELSDAMNRMAAVLQHERDNLESVVAERTRELSELNARLERLAVTDGLTGLYNHRRFQEAINAELLRSERHKRQLAVLMIDVDFFKKVNDAMGHPAGDELLRRLAEVLSKDLRQTDLIARYGGEEFAAILPETTRSEALQVGERMRAAVEERINQGTPWPTKVTVSIGVATYPEDGTTAERLIQAADQAMYVAKRQGRNRVVAARGGHA